ncbi:MAG: ABC transporter substrate-binding protein [Rhodospirillales bacterium]|nr:ABC transporter substrate-binding protein [Rhodospirillales bacterium]MBT4038859.1 ABC transporter substrate-binding protein [Rhodospirillales bacterium]MBT4627566.1 ABC transporter substrate-binding protein [Rhodospirillales bacterium]MBT5351770.1 ABC transporter substrate-binding protein [Rhodospirillales bacterium]MBT5521668.1 ABC transporter substrate-binding protein [Rhodospirillales bacterium]
MKKTIISVAGLAAVIALSFSVADAQAASCPIKIGGLAPLSAPGAVGGGEAMRDAMLFAERDINAAGGVLGCDVKVVIADTEGLPEKAAAVMEKLITQDGVVGVGGAYHSSVGVASKDISNARSIPTVFAETWNDTITGDKQKFIFRIAPLSSWASATLWQAALLVPNVKNVAIITENTDYGIPAAEETAKGLESGGVKSTTFGVDIGMQDFSGIIERVKAGKPDYIIVLNTGEAGYNFAQQAADAGIGPQDVPFQAGQVALESKAWWENVPDGNYAFVQRIGTPVSTWNDKAKKLNEDYKAKTGKGAIESYALEAYDSISILAQAINEANSTDGNKIVTALENISHDGTLGRIYFPYGTQKDPSVDGKGDEWWHQWPDPAMTMIQYQNEGEESTDSVIVWPDAYKSGDAVYVK